MGGRARGRSTGNWFNQFSAATESLTGAEHACSNRPGRAAHARPPSSTSPLGALVDTPPIARSATKLRKDRMRVPAVGRPPAPLPSAGRHRGYQANRRFLMA
jgi:hypothetical protein